MIVVADVSGTCFLSGHISQLACLLFSPHIHHCPFPCVCECVSAQHWISLWLLLAVVSGNTPADLFHVFPCSCSHYMSFTINRGETKENKQRQKHLTGSSERTITSNQLEKTLGQVVTLIFRQTRLSSHGWCNCLNHQWVSFKTHLSVTQLPEMQPYPLCTLFFSC